MEVIHKCEMCGDKVQGNEKDDELAAIEAEELWGIDDGMDDEEVAVVCEKCYGKLMTQFN